MKTELQAKFLQHLSQKKEDEGFTLIELLVVIIIIGILSAIALPSFLNQANKAKQSEAKQYIGSLNRAQQTHYLEKGYFASNDAFGRLGLGIKTDTANYSYVITDGASATGNTSGTQVTNQAKPKIDALKAYIGGVSIGEVTDTSETTSLAVLCEAEDAKVTNTSLDGAQDATFGTEGPSCPTGYVDLGEV
ncbi:type IV pilin-like G/H family protein [Coleofasciculus chthonoplastes]|uniref:type IV pilin-like G/H family protein n=1 Tax=Coleofasciculus chthonoplastes TaxID=64178 RepID=UPI0032FF1BC4